MYVRLKDNAPQVCTLADLCKNFPQVSFPRTPDESLLAAFDVYPLVRAPMPTYDPTSQTLREGTPENQDGRWILSWKIEPRSTADTAETVRRARDAELTSSDWVVVKHLEAGIPIPSAWADYRQALRDLPEQPGFPFTHAWPVKPE